MAFVLRIFLLWLGAGLVLPVQAAAPPEVTALRNQMDQPTQELQVRAQAMFDAETDPLRRSWIELALAELDNDLDNTEIALEKIARVHAVAIGANDLELQFEALKLAVAIHTNKGMSTAGTDVMGQLKALVELSGNPAWRVELLHGYGVQARKIGRFDEALDWFEQALAIAREVGEPSAIARELNSIGTLHGRTGRFADALFAHQEALELARSIGDRAEIARGLRLLGVLHRNLDDEERASATLEEALAYIDVRNHRESISVRSELAKSLLQDGQLERAEPFALESVRLAEMSGNGPNRVSAFTRLAELRLAQGRIDEAAEWAERAEAVYDRVALRDQVLLRLTRAQLWIAQGRPEALAEAEACVAGARELGDRILERQALDFLAELQLARGDAASAYVSRKAWQALDKSMAMDVSARRISVLEAQAERERERAQRALLESDLKEQSLTVYRQRLVGVALFGGFLLAALIIYGLYWRYRESRQRNADITASRDQLAQLHQALQRSAQDLERVARQDPLTGLNNRRAMVEYLHAAQADVIAGKAAIGVGIIDVDHFKRINDQNGHLVGDEVLKEIGRRLVAAVGADAKVGRWGGEEFLLLWTGRSLSACVAAAEQLRQVLAARAVVADNASVAVTASFGIAAVDAGGSLSLNELLASADRALYAAKAAGRNRVEYERDT